MPGVKVPVAAPNWALALASAPSCSSVLPWAGGNCVGPGFSAAASSSSAGGVVAVDDVVGTAVFVAVVEPELVELEGDEEPQPAAPSAPPARSSARMQAVERLICRAFSPIKC
jgi:hypothetical protein